MKISHRLGFLFIIISCLTVSLDAQVTLEADPQYSGADNEVHPPKKTDAWVIGFYMPPPDANSLASDVINAAHLALKDHQGQTGLPKIQFKRRWADEPWIAGAGELLSLVYEDSARLIVTLDTESGHLALQIAAKTKIPILSLFSSANTLDYSGVPWIFSMMPEGESSVRLITDQIKQNAYSQRAIIVTDRSRDARYLSDRLSAKLAAAGIPPQRRLLFSNVSDRLFESELKTISKQLPLILFGNANFLGQITEMLQRLHFQGDLYFPWTPGITNGLNRYKSLDGSIYTINPIAMGDRKKLSAFYQRYEGRYGIKTGPVAAYAYDLVSLILSVFKRSKGSRVSIRQQLWESSPYPGITGQIRWSKNGRNRSQPKLLRLK